MIKVTDLSKNYSTVEAVKSISFNIQDGEIVGFLGANGAGKTTTLKMMTGYLVPTSGQIEFNDLNIIDDTHEIQKQIGYLPELNPLYMEMRVYEYLEFLAGIRKIIGRQFKEALSRVIEECGLRGVVHKNIADCSKGYRQRIGLAAAMIHDPKILILDEATSSVDNETEAAIQRSLDILKKDRTVIVIAHRLSTVRNADIIYVLENGSVVESGNHESLLDIDGVYSKLWSVQTGENI